MKGAQLMGVKVELIGKEIENFDRLELLVREARESIKNHEIWGEKQAARYKEMAESAHELHLMLRTRGIEPKHHKYMLENREVPVDDIEFYNHIHPVEDLLAFIKDVDANNDPEDSTMGKIFKFKIYTRRWGHYDSYSIERISSGWKFHGTAICNSGECDKTGQPFLYRILDHDSVSYPYNLGELLEWLWGKAAEGLSESEVQAAIEDIANWVSLCEKNVPRGVFEDLL